MNLRRLPLATFALLLMGTALLAQAPPAGTETSNPKREKRMEGRAERQQQRIAKGVASGQLTPKETARLERQEGKINKDISKAEADGKITKKEAAKIEKEQNRESKRIYRQKHDAQKRR